MTSLHDELEKKLQDPNATPMFLPLEFLKTITCDFSDKSELGRGGYGVVYKGVLRSGKIIAVKKLFETRLKHEAFQNEISYLMGIKHQNVVQLVGYCAESRWEAIEQPSGSGKHILAEIPNRLLCFEYVSNRSLDKHIADRSLDLEWNIRYKIIMGICNGLHFLHEKCRIIHLDLKPENILMESNIKPKIADFGLSRIFGEQQSKAFTDNRVGTCGYMAPEYLNQGLVSKKADIFSLGVIIIEIVTGRRDYPYFQLDSPESIATSCQHFIEEVLGSWRCKFESTQKYKSKEIYNKQVKQCVAIALKCVGPVMEKRPTAKDVIQVLNALDQKSMGPVLLPKLARAVSVKFIARQGWLLVGSDDGSIHVYNYKKNMQKITSFKAHSTYVLSLAIHPTKSYVLSASDTGIKLWDWDQGWFGWKHMRTFKEHSGYVGAVAFKDYNSFASASDDGKIKVWSLDSPKSKYTLSGHSSYVVCVDFFTRDGQQYLISGSYDKTAKIWDMQEKECVHTLPHRSAVLSVLPHPKLPLLVTGTQDGDVYFWSSTSLRLKRILNIGILYWINCLACLIESGRIAIAHKEGLWVIEIRDEEEGEGCSNSNGEDSISTTD